MKWKGLLFLFGGLLAGVLIGVLIFLGGQRVKVSGATSRNLPPAVGSPIPDFELSKLNGGTQKLSNLKGKAVLINFWATWCPPCKEEMPLLEKVSQKYSDRLVVLGVNYEEDPDLVGSFVSEHGVTFPIVLDQAGLVTDRYFVRNFPVTFFVDADGVLRAQHLGVLDEQLLARYLKTIGITE